MDLNGKVVAVTGSAQGLGFCMAERPRRGGRADCPGRPQSEKLDEAVTGIEAMGGKARAYVANVARRGGRRALFADIGNDFGALHGVITNAGVLRDGLMVKAKDGEGRRQAEHGRLADGHRRQSHGCFLCAREAAAKMIELAARA
jgi:3-oxoacyl-[acyl-carrier protein] reductase